MRVIMFINIVFTHITIKFDCRFLYEKYFKFNWINEQAPIKSSRCEIQMENETESFQFMIDVVK